MAKTTATETDIQEKIYNLSVELAQAKKDRKETVKAHGDNVKRIQAEIDELIDGEEDAVTESQKNLQ